MEEGVVERDEWIVCIYIYTEVYKRGVGNVIAPWQIEGAVERHR